LNRTLADVGDAGVVPPRRAGTGSGPEDLAIDVVQRVKRRERSERLQTGFQEIPIGQLVAPAAEGGFLDQ
jgi:hypothetical protein